MRARIFLGDDKGRRLYKVYAGLDTGSGILIPNVICRGFNVDDDKNPLKINRMSNPRKITLLDAVIIKNGDESTKERYHVGEYALANNKNDLINMSRGAHKYSPLSSRFTIAIQVILHAYFVYSLGHQDAVLYSESCVPLDESERAENEDQAKENASYLSKYAKEVLENEYEVRFLDPAFNQAAVKIIYKKQTFSTEGKNALLAEIYDADTMEPNEAMSLVLQQGGLGGLNIGSTTTDPAAINKELIGTRIKLIPNRTIKK